MSSGRNKIATAGFAVVAGFLTLSGVCRAEDLTTSDEIMKALAPKALVTRSLSGTHSDAQAKIVQVNIPDSLRNRIAGSLSPDDRQRLTALADGRPNIDISVNFEFDSDRIGAAAVPATDEIGKALISQKLAGGTFLVAGHTDGKGTDDYNQRLSERRAEAVKAYLVAHYQIPAANLITVGYGKTKLKDVSNPLAPENRRVQLVNMTATAVAKN
jgi:outer membrane protein OmpA-like peptidoglycan-associated protein